MSNYFLFSSLNTRLIRKEKKSVVSINVFKDERFKYINLVDYRKKYLSHLNVFKYDKSEKKEDTTNEEEKKGKSISASL